MASRLCLERAKRDILYGSSYSVISQRVRENKDLNEWVIVLTVYPVNQTPLYASPIASIPVPGRFFRSLT